MRRNPAGVIAEPSVEVPAEAPRKTPAKEKPAAEAVAKEKPAAPEISEVTEAMEAAATVKTPAAASAEPLRYIREEYRVFEKDLSQITIDNFYDRRTKRLIKDAISEIVQVEGPISQPALIRTLINSTGLGGPAKTFRNIWISWWPRQT